MLVNNVCTLYLLLFIDNGDFVGWDGWQWKRCTQQDSLQQNTTRSQKAVPNWNRRCIVAQSSYQNPWYYPQPEAIPGGIWITPQLCSRIHHSRVQLVARRQFQFGTGEVLKPRGSYQNPGYYSQPKRQFRGNRNNTVALCDIVMWTSIGIQKPINDGWRSPLTQHQLEVEHRSKEQRLSQLLPGVFSSPCS